MKVILKEDIKGLGRKEDMVNVSDGYARNYLLPRGIAVEASGANLNVMRERKEAEKTRKDRELAQAKDYAERLAQINLEMYGKAGEHGGRLFGSITAKDIADALKKQHKLDIDKKKIALEEPIKSLGETLVDIKLYAGMSAQLRVTVVQQKDKDA